MIYRLSTITLNSGNGNLHPQLKILIMKKVFTVKTVDVVIDKSAPPVLSIDVTGEVLTSGWKNPDLSAYVYVRQPEDGVYDFDFIAQEPEGIALEVITPISLSYKTTDFDHDINGVKIHASENFIVAFIDNSKRERIAIDQTGLIKMPHGEIIKLVEANAHFNINNVYIWENVLHLNVTYGGGCREHLFKLLWDGSFMESFPPKVSLFISHDNNADPCKAIVTQDLQFVLPEEIRGSIILLDGWRAPMSF
jgi:hypothetical protein